MDDFERHITEERVKEQSRRTKGDGAALWRRMYFFWMHRREEFPAHYHRRFECRDHLRDD